MDKGIAIKNRILSLLEETRDDKRLPSARMLAGDFNVSFQFVQRVVDALADSGVIRVFPRSGMEAHPYWRKRIISGVFCVPEYSWFGDRLKRKLQVRFPEIYATSAFEHAPMEISVTHQLISHHNDYCELGNMLASVLPDRSAIFSRMLDAGKFGGGLCGIPLLFSPKVMILNKKLFDACGCPLPSEDWTWSEFEETVCRLAKKLAPFRAFGTWCDIIEWMNFVTVNGGCIYDEENNICLDAPESLEALKFFYTLVQRAKVPDEYVGKYNHIVDFRDGNVAISSGQRQILSNLIQTGAFRKEELVLRPMPVKERGTAPRSMLAASFFCVRQECVNMTLARDLLEFLLSEEFQYDVIGAIKCGIPVRCDSARRSFDTDDPHDAVFARTLSHVVPKYNIPNPVSYTLLSRAMASALNGSFSELETNIKELSDTLRSLKRFGIDAG